MIRTAFIAGTAALILAPLAQAEHASSATGYDGYQNQRTQVRSNCQRQKSEDRLLGGVIGAVAGGALGVAIADNNSSGHRSARRYRGYGGHHGYGYRRNNNGDELAGALIGGVLGAVIGSELAGSGTNCRTTSNRYNYVNVAPPTRRAFASGQTHRVNAGPTYSYPRAGTYPAQQQPLYGGPAPAPTRQPVRAAPPVQPLPVHTPQCQTVQRETRLPDGTMVREPVSVCQSANGRWQVQDGQSRY